MESKILGLWMKLISNRSCGLHSKLTSSEKTFDQPPSGFLLQQGRFHCWKSLVLNFVPSISTLQRHVCIYPDSCMKKLCMQFTWLCWIPIFLIMMKELRPYDIHNIPSIKTKGEFCFKWIDPFTPWINRNCRRIDVVFDEPDLLCSCIEGLFLRMQLLLYVYFMIEGTFSGTGFREQTGSSGMKACILLQMKPLILPWRSYLFNEQMNEWSSPNEEAIECEMQFAKDILDHGVVGLSSWRICASIWNLLLTNSLEASCIFQPDFMQRIRFHLWNFKTCKSLVNFLNVVSRLPGWSFGRGFFLTSLLSDANNK